MNRINKVEEIGVVCLQETWTSENEDIRLLQLPNYKLFHKGKKCCNHGGLFIYLHERFDVEPWAPAGGGKKGHLPPPGK